jgi:succinoglycan biosynthesis transport protein ExoP
VSLTTPKNARLMRASQSFGIHAGTMGSRLPFGRDMNLAQLGKTLRRAWWLIALTGTLGGALAYGYARLTPDIYMASAILAVEPQRFTIPELQGAVSGEHASDPFPEVLTEVQVLTSRRLLQQVVDTLHLDKHPEFDPRAQTTSYVSQVLKEIRQRVEQVLPDVSRPPGQQAADASSNTLRQLVVDGVARHLGVWHDTRSLIITIFFTANDPKLAATVVNTLLDAYSQNRYIDRERINKAANASLMRRIDDIRGEVVKLEEKIRAARAKNNLPELTVGSVNQQQLAELISAATRSNTERTQAETIAARAHSLADAGATDQLASVIGSPTISRLRDQEAEAGRTFAESQSRYGSGNPLLQATRANLQSIRTQIDAEVRRTVASLDAQAQIAIQQDRQAQAALNSARSRATQTAGGQLEVKQLEQEATARRTLYETLLARAEQTQTDPGSNQMMTGARVVSDAAVPGIPSGPKRSLAAAGGAASGMLGGAFLAIVGSRRSRKFRNGADLESAIGLPVIAQLPPVQKLVTQRRLPRLLHSDIPGHREAEGLRLLRSRIRYGGGTATLRTVVFVAAGGEADAAGMAVAFARVAALDGERVLLVEGSLAEPGLSTALGPLLSPAVQNGLTNFLGETSSLRDAVAADPVSGMDMLLVRLPSPSLLDMVHGARFRMLMADATQSYGLVVVNAPGPNRSETLSLAHGADVTIFVVGSGRVRSTDLRASIANIVENTYGYTAAVLAA